MTNHNNGKSSVRGPYHGEGRMPSPPSSSQLVRYESTHEVDYSQQYNMPLRNFRSGNNGRSDGGIR